MIRAVLFDFGGTLYDYSCLSAAEAESLQELAGWAGVQAPPVDLARAYRDSMRQVFRAYVPQPYYLHRDLFRDAAVGMLRAFSVEADANLLERYRQAQWARHRRDFVLRPGVVETLAELRRRGLHVGMVSNIDEDQLAHLLEVAGVAEYFHAIISSERAGSCKPAPGIYHHALASAGCAPDEALFVGDTQQQDIAGANLLGLQSVLLWHREDRSPPTGEPRPRHVIRSIPDLLPLAPSLG